MLKGAIKCPDCEGSPMNKLTCRASSKHGGGTYTYYRCTGTGSRRKGCGNMVRMEVVDAAVNEIMATTFRVRVKRLILVKGTDYQDQLDEISYRIRALDPDVMSDEQFDEQVRRLRAERDRLKALPAEPDRWDEQLTGGAVFRHLPGAPRGRARRVADLARVRDPRHEERSQRDPGRRERDSSPRVSSEPFILLAGLQCRLRQRPMSWPHSELMREDHWWRPTGDPRPVPSSQAQNAGQDPVRRARRDRIAPPSTRPAIGSRVACLH